MIDITVDNPNPGHPDAVAQGCTCPQMDNGHGKLDPVTVKYRGWIMSSDCPLHGDKTGEPVSE